MKKRIALIAVLIALTAPLVMARPHRAPGLLGHLQKMKAELGITDAQSAQLKAIMVELRTQNEQYREQLQGGRKDIATILLANPSNVSAAQALLDKQANAERAMKANRLNATAKALAVLNAEQRAELSEKLAEFAERRAERRRR
ncbi:MAG TPA: Spy/CpxP family protein refolding chaperone [Thermoanaerobaculia bacterium]|jgi:Spy/CpxP family protein refolding chaperone